MLKPGPCSSCHRALHVLQVLFSEAGYKYIDVRPAFEFDDAGHCKQAINVPVMNLERKWSPEEQKKARSIFHALEILTRILEKKD